MGLPSFWVERHGGCRSIGRAEHIGAEDEETTGVKGLAVPHERAPPEEAISACTMIGCVGKNKLNVPVFNIRAASEGMAYYHDVIPGIVQLSPRLVSDGGMFQDAPGL